MPIYEFQCPECRRIFEEFFFSSHQLDDEGAVCPTCQNVVKEKLISSCSSTDGVKSSSGAGCGSSGFT
jgi:putative FmdB family regulatory protein